MKRILFYYPSNKASVVIETTLQALQKIGHTILFLTTCEEGVIHKNLQELGIETYANPSGKSNSIIYYLRQIRFLSSFVKKHRVDIVFSNLQHANFIAVLAQKFMKVRLIAFRHHFKYNKGDFGIPLKVNKNEVLFDKVINRLAKEIVVPSEGVYNGIKQYEKVDINKLSIIPYLYDFSKYGSPNLENVKVIKKQFSAKLLIIMVARLIPFKRHILMLPVFKKLIEEGYDIQVMILDEGPEKQSLKNYINENNLNNKVHLIGFTRQFLDYMKAADLLIHPSITEASNNVVKEIALMGKAVAVCKGVGDFDEYIQSGVNGYQLDIAAPEVDAEKVIKEVYADPNRLLTLGAELKKTVLTKFKDNTLPLQKYTELIDENVH